MNRTKAKPAFINHLNILSYAFPVTEECRQHLLDRPMAFQTLQLGSDIQIYLTCTRLAPSLARYAFLIYPTVFVNIFLICCSIIVKKPLNSQGFFTIFLSSAPPFPYTAPARDHADKHSDQNCQHHRCACNSHLLCLAFLLAIIL